MVSMSDFKSFPRPGEHSICEHDGRLSTLPISEINIGSYDHPLIAIYPDINISRELIQSSAHSSAYHYHQSTDDSSASPQNVLIPVNESLVKRFSRTFFESGFVAALQVASEEAHSRTPTHPYLSWTSAHALRLLTLFNQLKAYVVQPFDKNNQLDSSGRGEVVSIARFCQTRDWNRSLIRVIRWHPNCFRVAVAACDDSIRIYSDDINVVPVLKNHIQKGITSMAWRPYTAGEIAVGCQNGVVIWSWDPNSQIARPLSQAIHLKDGHHFPVTSVGWSSNGKLLATASINDSDIRIWDVDQNRNTPLRRVGAPCAHLLWSPDGSKMFTSTVGNVFRVWTTDTWTPERWTVPQGTIQSAAWSPCGGYLMFVTSEELSMYCLSFIEEQLFTNSSMPKQALPVADLTRITVDSVQVGGRAQSIAWCPAGRHLAVIFKDSAVVAIFLTSINRTKLSIVPDCFLVGLSAEYPTFISFQDRYKNKPETVLTIGWSSGRVQFFPFV